MPTTKHSGGRYLATGQTVTMDGCLATGQTVTMDGCLAPAHTYLPLQHHTRATTVNNTNSYHGYIPSNSTNIVAMATYID